MSLFRFDIKTHDSSIFSVQLELSDLACARIEAVRTLGQMLCDNPARIWDDEDCQIEVSSEAGLLLYVIQVSALKAAATRFTD